MSVIKGLASLLLAYMFVGWVDAQAVEITGQCVYPKGDPSQITVLTLPLDKAPVAETHVLYRAYYVGSRNGHLIALWTVPDYARADPFNGAGLLIGWVRKDQFDLQDFRNCT